MNLHGSGCQLAGGFYCPWNHCPLLPQEPRNSHTWWSNPQQYLLLETSVSRNPLLLPKSVGKWPPRPSCLPGSSECLSAATCVLPRILGPTVSRFSSYRINRKSKQGRSGPDCQHTVGGTLGAYDKKKPCKSPADVSQQTPATAVDFMFNQVSEQWKKENSVSHSVGNYQYKGKTGQVCLLQLTISKPKTCSIQPLLRGRLLNFKQRIQLNLIQFKSIQFRNLY